jgi:hypothetical protein
MAYCHFIGLPPRLDHRRPGLAFPSIHENQCRPHPGNTHPLWSRPCILFLRYCCTFWKIPSLGSRCVYIHCYHFGNYGSDCQIGTEWSTIHTVNCIPALILHVCVDGIDWVREQSVSYKCFPSRPRQGCRAVSFAYCWYCKREFSSISRIFVDATIRSMFFSGHSSPVN